MACSACQKKKENKILSKCIKCGGFVEKKTLLTRTTGKCVRCGKVYQVRR